MRGSKAAVACINDTKQSRLSDQNGDADDMRSRAGNLIEATGSMCRHPRSYSGQALAQLLDICGLLQSGDSTGSLARTGSAISGA